MPSVAKVAVVSSLPQLDRLFDYLIPVELAEHVELGSRVKVPFGNSTKSLEGFVFELTDRSDFTGKLSSILEVLGVKPSLSPGLLELSKEIASRSASSLGEVLKLFAPSHMPRAYKAHFEGPLNKLTIHDDTQMNLLDVDNLTSPSSRHAVLAKPGIGSLGLEGGKRSLPHWVELLVSIAGSNLVSGKSTILAVPDFRDHDYLLEAFAFLGLEGFISDYSQDQTKSQVYEAYLRALDDDPRIIIGSRSVVLAPAFKLGSIVVFDDGDRSYTDQSAPYLNARDSSLIRQSIEGCSLVFVSHARSTEVQRLVETGYLLDSSQEHSRPKISVSEPGFRIDSHAFNAIKRGLEVGSVLVQVASKGESTALFCASCDKRVSCAVCAGPIWVDGAGARKCRWCNAMAQDLACECGETKVSKGRAGATRTAAELGRSFPYAKIVESTGESRIVKIKPGKNLVIATAGAEPFVEGGYQSVVLLDAQTLLSKQFLRATEEAVRLWANAVAKLANGGEAVLVGVSGALAQRFCLWQQSEIAADELATRRELMLPPALRLGSVSGAQALLVELAQSLEGFDKVKLVGPAPYSISGESTEWRLIVKYNYADTVDVAKRLRSETILLSKGKSVIASSGRAVRALKIRMSDGDVI